MRVVFVVLVMVSGLFAQFKSDIPKDGSIVTQGNPAPLWDLDQSLTVPDSALANNEVENPACPEEIIVEVKTDGSAKELKRIADNLENLTLVQAGILTVGVIYILYTINKTNQIESDLEEMQDLLDL